MSERRLRRTHGVWAYLLAVGIGFPINRFARYVGPDGFPQFQRGSVAEYVQILYDRAGWEDAQDVIDDGK